MDVDQYPHFLRQLDGSKMTNVAVIVDPKVHIFTQSIKRNLNLTRFGLSGRVSLRSWAVSDERKSGIDDPKLHGKYLEKISPKCA